MARSDEEQAAYFALLRAREELAALRRYSEYLVAERSRIDDFVARGTELDTTVDARLRRALRHTDEPLGEALELRRRVIADERRRLPERIDAAQAYVDECETAHAAKRQLMYRDDPLDDEAELRAVVGDEPVDHLLDEPVRADDERSPLLAALDVLRVLQGWVDDDDAGRWFTTEQRRLGNRTPVDVLAAGAYEDVEDAARAYAAADS